MLLCVKTADNKVLEEERKKAEVEEKKKKEKEEEKKKKEEEEKKKEAAPPTDQDTTPTTAPSSRIEVDTQISSTSDDGKKVENGQSPTEETDSDLRLQADKEKDSMVKAGGSREGPKDEKMETEVKENVGGVEAGKEKDRLEAEEVQEMEVDEKQEEKMEVDEKKEKKSEGEVTVKEDSAKETGDVDKMEVEEKLVEEDPVSLASRQPREMDSRIGESEKTYGVMMLEKTLGLLTAILPQEMTVSLCPLICSHANDHVIPCIYVTGCSCLHGYSSGKILRCSWWRSYSQLSSN